MLREKITDHSPMNDYRKILSLAKYTIEYASNVTDIEQPNRVEKLTNNKAYKISYKLMIGLLITAGAGVVLSVLAGFIAFSEADSQIMKMIFLTSVIITIVCFIGAILIGLIGMPFEQRAEKKDREISISLDRKTWVLSNGQVVVSDEQKRRSMQLYDGNKHAPMSDTPFRKMIIIYKVHSVKRVDGRIIADAETKELYIVHPPDDGCLDYSRYTYYQEFKREKVYWYENMYGRERLLEALNNMNG